MRIVDVSAFYAPTGGGVRTYVNAKLQAAHRYGHELVLVAPGQYQATVERSPGAIVVTVPAPTLPVDRRYRYFDDEKTIHRLLDQWHPNHVEVSSPWSSATMVGRWQGSATRSLIMHSDPLAAYAYRWLGGIAPTTTIDRWFGWFWRHLRGLGQMFDLTICANDDFAARLTAGGMAKVELFPMGVEAGRFSPKLRSIELREVMLLRLGLTAESVLLVGAGRLSGEKRWDMVMRAVGRLASGSRVGLILAGDGRNRRQLKALAARYSNVLLLPRIERQSDVARLLASADALVHGCESETFCMIAAEARASGLPLIVPDRGGAFGQLSPGVGSSYRAASEQSLREAIEHFIERGVELQRAAAVRSSKVRTMADHFDELFARYQMLGDAVVPAEKSSAA